MSFSRSSGSVWPGLTSSFLLSHVHGQYFANMVIIDRPELHTQFNCVYVGLDCYCLALRQLFFRL